MVGYYAISYNRFLLSSRASRATKTAFSSPYTQNNISYFGGMYRKNKGVPGLELATYRHAHQKQACTLLYTCVAWFFFSFLMGCCPLHNIKPTLRTSTDFYCLLVLLVRQKQRFHQPTLRTTSVTLVVCIEKIKGCRV